MFTQETISEIAAVARELGIEPAALLAVAEVESGGKAFATVEGRLEPLIRFEGHYFDRRLTPAKRQAARRQGLASPLAGAVVNPASQAERWKLLARASAIDRKAALESVSWGLGQVMGAHWAWLDYASVEALADEARNSVAGQARLMARYIAKAGLRAALIGRDWHAFARGYNGPTYRRFGYHTKIAAAYKRHAATQSRNRTAAAADSKTRASAKPTPPTAETERPNKPEANGTEARGSFLRQLRGLITTARK
jgi:N-acetylmuramidase